MCSLSRGCSGWVFSNCATIWLSSCSVLPDHIVSQLMVTTDALAASAVPSPVAPMMAAVAIAIETLGRRLI